MLIAIKTQRIAILKILGHTVGSCGRHKWRDQWEQDLGIKKIVDEWKTSVHLLKWKSDAEEQETLNITQYGPSYWCTLPSRVDVQLCTSVLHRLKYLLHGKLRHAERLTINEKVRHRENMIALGKHGQYLRLVLGETSPRYTLDSLTMEDGSISTDPDTILETITAHFQNHYATPERHKGGIHDPTWNWKTGGSKAEFHELIKHHKIPLHLTNIIWNAMKKVPKATTIKAELTESFKQPPTFEDFCKSIPNKPSKSAGGLSGLNYNMMKAWSPEVKQIVYDNLIVSWGTTALPEWWKYREVCLKPKDPNNISPDTLRPIVLVEVLRKLWIGLIIQKINYSWTKHDVLHPSQHGFRAKRGTDTALMQLQTMFEESSGKKAPLFLSSWDISKAFDSLSKNTLRFSWTRLGVPEDIADLLVSLDEDGHTIIRTPKSQEIWDKLKHKGFTTLKEFFDAERGTGQGDVGSPFNWDAAYDILLCALDTVKEGRFYTLGADGTLTPSGDIAYADDLLSGMSTLSGLQLKADIVSAFAIIFGLDIANAKLRTFLHQPYLQGKQKQKHVLHILIHTTGWVEHQIRVKHSGVLKSLGMLYDISSEHIYKTQHQATLLREQRSCNILLRTRGSPKNLVMATRCCIGKRIEYTGKFAANSKAALEEIDKPISQLYKHITHNMQTSSTAHLYLPQSMGGLGLQRPSDDIQNAKFSIIQRHLLAGGEISRNMETLLHNAMLNASLHVPEYVGTTIYPPIYQHNDTCWAESFLRHIDSANLQLCRSGPTPLNSHLTPIVTTSRPYPESKQWEWTHEHHIHNVGDLFSLSPDGSTLWHDFSSSAGSHLTGLQTLPPLHTPTEIGPLQIWAPSAGSTLPSDVMVEIMGWISKNPPLLNIRKWHSSTTMANITTHSTVTSGTGILRGGATNSSLPPLLALGFHPRRIFASAPTSHSTGQRRTVDVITQPTRYSYTLPKATQESWLPEKLITLLPQLGEFDIFTDGSWAEAGSAWSRITRNNPRNSGSGGIAIISRSAEWMNLPIIVMHISNGQTLEAKSAFSMELLALLTGLSIITHTKQPATIYTDCESAVKKLQKLMQSPAALKATSRDVQLLAAATSHLRNGLSSLQWIRGHPERKQKDEEQWTREMWGNHLADRAAAGALTSKKYYQYNSDSAIVLHIESLPTRDAHPLTSALTVPGTWYLGNKDRQLMASSVMESIRKQRLKQYLQDRDAKRKERELPPKWEQYDIPLAATLWKLTNKNASNAFYTRLIFDSHWHPGNQVKSVTDPIQRAVIGKCPLCDHNDSSAHWSTSCNHPRANKLRSTLASNIDLAIKTHVDACSETNDRSFINHFGTEYKKYIFGSETNPIIPDTWKGLWTSAQLDSFRTGPEDQFIPFLVVNSLKKLFLELGGILTSTFADLWMARQVTINELTRYMKKHPDPNYTPPSHQHVYTHSDLPPLTEEELTSVRLNAIKPANLPHEKISLMTSNRRLRGITPPQPPPIEVAPVNPRVKDALPTPMKTRLTLNATS